MKINGTQGYQKYQSYMTSIRNDEPTSFKALLDEHVSTQGAGNTDKVMISEDAVLKAELGRATTAMSLEIDSLGGAERLNSLQKAIQDGTYNVSTDELADAILGYQV